MKRTILFLTFGIALGGTSASAQGQMLFEPFNYSAGNIEGQSGGGSFGFSAAWDDQAGTPEITVPSGGGLTSTAYTSRGFAPVGLSLKSPVGAGTNHDFLATRALSSAISLDVDATHYFSFLVRGDWTNLSTSRGFNVGFTSSSTLLSSNSVTIKKDYNTQNLFAAVGGNNTGSSLTNGVTDNQVRFVVVKLVTSSSGNETLSFVSYLPTASVPASEDFSGGVVSQSLGSLTESLAYLVIQGRVNDSGMYYEFDEIRLGSTWDSVTTVPEPALLSWLAFASLMLRRRSIGGGRGALTQSVGGGTA